MKLEDRLHQGLAELALALPAGSERRLLEFLRLLGKWSRAYNLTAVRDPHAMVARHLLDSLVVAPFLSGPRILDIGTGAGLPGIPLAIARPDFSFTLLDANAKKTRFVVQAAHELALTNVEVVNARLEAYRPEKTFDTLLARAFATIPDMLMAARHLCHPGGRFLAMKGVFPDEELAAIPAGYASEVRPLTVPGLNAARHLVIVTLNDRRPRTS